MTPYSPDPRHLDRSAGGSGSSPPDDGRAGLAPAASYRAWDGSQAVPNLTADEVVDALAEDVLEHGDLREAMRRLMERGVRSGDPSMGDLRGLRDLVDRLRERRREVLEQGRLEDPLAEVRRELDEIIATERASVQRRLDETEPGTLRGSRPGKGAGAEGAEPAAAADGVGGSAGPVDEDGEPVDEGAEPVDEGAEPEPESAPGRPDRPPDPALRQMLRSIGAQRLDRLDSLPPDTGARIRGLQDYDFLEPEARRRFEGLLDRLRRGTLDRLSRGLADAARGLRPEDLAAQREMVRNLNRLLGRRVAGDEPGAPEVEEFLDRHGRFFPGAESLDDVVDQLADRMTAMQSLIRSMSPAQRAELQDTIDAVLRDDRLRWDLAQLAANLDQLVPGGLGERVTFAGDPPLGLESALELLDRLQALDRLEDRLDGVGGPDDLGAVDRSEVRELLGDDAVRDLDVLEDLAGRLEDAGYLARDGDRLELTPRGTRRIGQKVLDDLFARLRRDAFGGHRVSRAGRGGEREETAKPFEFGDPFHLDLGATMANALVREDNAPGRRPPGAPVRLRPDDFEVARTELTTSAATVLLVDMSRSMLLRGCYLAAKRVAVALDTLIRTQYPRDQLTVVGFAYYARELRPEALAVLGWHEYEYGTNLQHGLQLARRILARSRAANREIVVITDGEPTAHFEAGQVEFSYPPTRRTIEETLREVVRCTREGVTINTFMLERSKALTDFVALVTRLNRGRAFYAEPEHLGEYVLVDFVRRRTGSVS